MIHRYSKLLMIVVAVAVTIGSIVGHLFAGEDQAKEKQSKTKAPEKFQVRFETSKGVFVVEVVRKWSPNGADRFHELVKKKFYDGCRFFRVIDGFMAQFGINGDPEVETKWRENNIKDDPVVESNKRGFVSFAKSGRPNSRTTQLFINYTDNSRLDESGFAPFGRVTEGMKVVDSLYDAYGESPSQTRIQRDGNEYLKEMFPKLDYIKKATIVTKKKDGDDKTEKNE